jgi:hypothetical protein
VVREISSAQKTSYLDRARDLYFRLPRGDRVALFLLIVFPILLYVPFSLAGHPVLPGDDLTQNLPLRVLSGSIIRSGHLPTWNQLIFSGTPLLGGWNAGAWYPGTWLFAFLSIVAAWTLNLVAVPIICATGTYVFLRRLRCRPLASTIGALAFTYTGFMSGQIVHIGLVEGTSFLPWTLVAIDGVFSVSTRRNLCGYVALLGTSLGATILAGDPRAATSASIVAGIYVIACTYRKRRRVALPLGAVLTGAFLGIFISAIQWLPGLSFLNNSQRGVTVYNFFGSGSIGLTHLASLLLAPYFLGGNGNFGTPLYEGNYNIAEITVGTGLISLVAAGAYLPELCASLFGHLARRRTSKNPSSSARKPLGVWYVLIVVGVLLTLGSTTPLGHVLVHLPLYGSERLQNRNAVIFDFALIVLLAFFIDDFTRAHVAKNQAATNDAGDEGSVRDVLGQPVGRMLAVLPLAGAFALILTCYCAPHLLITRLQDHNATTSVFEDMSGYLIPILVIAAVAALFIFFHQRIPSRYRVIALAVIALCDMALYVVNASYATAPTSVFAAQTPYSQKIAKLDGTFGRYAIYDPRFLVPETNSPAPAEAGVSDLNIFQDNPSVQGYASLVQGVYQEATQTHSYEGLATSRLSGETFNSLDLKTLLTLPEYFGEVIGSHSPVPVPRSTSPKAQKVATQNGATTPVTGVQGPWSIASNGALSWTLPGPVTVVRASVFGQGLTPQALADLSVDFVTTSGSTNSTISSVRDNQVYFVAPTPSATTSVVIENPTQHTAVIRAVVVVTANPDERIVLNGPLQGGLSPPHWSYEGTIGPYLVYGNSETRGLSWLQPVGTKTPETKDIASGSVEIENSVASTSQVMVVNAREDALLVRSETYSPGWSARIRPVGGGPTLVKSARRFGLVQTVEIPKGRYVVTWRYAPRQILIGLVLSALGILVLLGLVIAHFGFRRASKTVATHDQR